jgi:hypothetical protein
MVVEHRLPTRMIEGHGEDGDLSGVENTDSERCMNRGRRNHAHPIGHGLRDQGDRGIVGLAPHDLVQNGLGYDDLDVRTRLEQQVETAQLREHDQRRCVNDAQRASSPVQLSTPRG